MNGIKLSFRKALFSVLCFLFTLVAEASHLVGGYVTYKKVSNTSFTYEISYIGLRDNDHHNISGTFHFGDGVSESDNYQISATPLNDSIDIVKVSLNHTFAAPGTYHVGYSENSRNPVINIEGASQFDFYVESMIVIDPFLGYNQSPVFDSMFLSQGKTAEKLLLNFSATDPNDDSLSYEIIRPLIVIRDNIPNYLAPHHPSFYTNYTLGNEERNGPASLLIDEHGMLQWDAPGDRHVEAIEQYLINIMIKEWRKVESEWVNVGSLTRELIIHIESLPFKVSPLVVHDQQKVSIYPNPSIGTFSINGDLSNYSAIKLISQEGKLIFERSVNPQDFDGVTLTLENSPDNGLYIIQFFDLDRRLVNTEKLIIAQ